RDVERTVACADRCNARGSGNRARRRLARPSVERFNSNTKHVAQVADVRRHGRYAQTSRTRTQTVSARSFYATINKSRTALTPGAIHAASLARSRAYHDPTTPSSVTKPSTTLTRMKRASRSALRLSARPPGDVTSVVCGRP